MRPRRLRPMIVGVPLEPGVGGITVTYETIRQWCLTFGPSYARTLRRRRGRMGDTWHLDELFVTLNGRLQYLWRAVDEDGDVLDILVQSRRNRPAAVRHPDHSQVTYATCCSGHGFKASPAIGEALADLALDRQTRVDIEPFRFRW